MGKKIAIIGAGWYGCHIGSTLKQHGHDVTVYEKSGDVMSEASGNNQFRLHMGFHYARHHRTRVQSRDGYQRFIERYPTLSSISKFGNIYSVPKYDSLIDFHTYKAIMMTSGIDFKEIENPDWSFDIEGSVNCDERVVETAAARKLFKNKLGDNLILGHWVDHVMPRDTGVEVDGVIYDYLVDCTWGHFSTTRSKVFYETTILGYYKTDVDFPAFTLVDGPLCSIYPTEEPGLYTLSSVTHTPIAVAWDIKDLNRNISQDQIAQKIGQLETHIRDYVPNFSDMFEYVGPQLSVKTKIYGKSDDRSCSVEYNDKCITVMSGKIDTIFHAMEQVQNYIEKND